MVKKMGIWKNLKSMQTIELKIEKKNGGVSIDTSPITQALADWKERRKTLSWKIMYFLHKGRLYNKKEWGSELSAKDDEEMFKIHTRLEVLKELHKAFEDWGLRFAEERDLPMQKEAEVLYSAIKDSSAYKGETIEELRQKLLMM